MERRPSILRKLQVSGIGVAILVVSFGAALAPRPAYALGFDIVKDPFNFVVNNYTRIAAGSTAISSNALATKELALDPLAWFVAKVALQSITKSIVTWINSGFQGSPAFVTDLTQRLSVVGDTIATNYLNQLLNSTTIKSPFSDQVTQSLKNAYFSATNAVGYFQYAYSLSQHSSDPAAFTQGDFSKGGFSAWFSLQQCQNNSLCSYLQLSNDLADRINNAQNSEKSMLSWGGGFRSYTNCQASAPVTTGTTNLTQTDPCLGKTITTPGSVIAAQVNKAVGAGQDQLVTADEFDEIIGALMGQLVNHVLGGTGLGGLSTPSAGGGASYIDQAANPSQYSTGATNSLTQNFSATIAGQEQAIKQYQADWQRIQTEANAAQACNTDPTTADPSIAATLSTAGTNLARAATALSQLDTLNTQAQAAQDATSAGTNQSTQISSISDAYSALLTAGTLPTDAELSDADAQAANTPGSLFSNMEALVTCPAGQQIAAQNAASTSAPTTATTTVSGTSMTSAGTQ